MPTTDPKQKRDQNLKRRYGISIRSYNKLLTHQGGMCAACGGPPGTEDGVFRVDHDHATGSVRGLLCLACNAALGNVQDKPATLARLKLYLETHAPAPALPAPVGLIPTGPEMLGSTSAPNEEKAKDPRIPTPEVIAALKGHGMSEGEIAAEFDLDRAQVRALYSESQRSNRADNARDVLLQKALPHALVTIIQAVQDGDAKTAMGLVKGLGVLKDTLDTKETGNGVGKPLSLEEWRSRITGVTVERLTAVLAAPVDPTAPAGQSERPADLVLEADTGGVEAGQAGLAPSLPAGAGLSGDAQPEAHPSTSPRSTWGVGTV